MSRDGTRVLITNPGADLYGSDRMTLETVKALRARGFAVTVALPGPGPLEQLLLQAGAVVLHQQTPVMRKSSLSPLGVLRLAHQAASAVLPSWRLLRRSGAKTVLVNTITTPLWFPLARLAGMRVACHVHEAEAAVPRLVQWAMYLPMHFCHRVIANSSYTRRVLSASSFGLASRVDVVHNTVPGPQEVVAPRGTLDGRVNLLYVGRLSHRKGPHVAVAAVALLRERGVNAHLDVVGAVFPGNESYEAHLREEVSRRGLSRHVLFHGFQPSVWQFLADCDIVLIPSVGEESFGNTAVEAALAARPVVASSNAGLTEATSASTSAELVPPGDPQAMSSAVERIVENWDRCAAHALTDAGRVGERFSEERYAALIMEALGLTSRSSPGDAPLGVQRLQPSVPGNERQQGVPQHGHRKDRVGPSEHSRRGKKDE